MIGAGEHFFGTVVAFAAMRDPQTHGDRTQRVAYAEAGDLHLGAYAFRNVQRHVQCCLDQHDDKLLPAVARYIVDIADRLFKNRCDIHQYLITGAVTVVVVDRLEVVEIEHQHGEWPVVAPEARELVGQDVVEFLAVVQTGEAVGDGEHFQQLILLLQGLICGPDLGVASSQPIDHHVEYARQVADLACRCTAQLNAQVAAGDAVGGGDQTVEWRDDGAAHPIGDDAHQQCQSSDQQEEELEQFEPCREDLGAASFRHDDYWQRTRHIRDPENFA